MARRAAEIPQQQPQMLEPSETFPDLYPPQGQPDFHTKLLPSQEELRYLLGIEDDEILDAIRSEIWGPVSRHISLTNITEADIPFLMAKVRDIFRVAQWSRKGSKIPYHHYKNLELYFEARIRKSIDHEERILSTGFLPLSQQPPMPTHGMNRPPQSMLSGFLSAIGLGGGGGKK